MFVFHGFPVSWECGLASMKSWEGEGSSFVLRLSDAGSFSERCCSGEGRGENEVSD